MSADAPLLLYGVFRQLIHNRVPLGVPDYLDVLRALKWQMHSDNPTRFDSRDDLRRLCQRLWARSPDEIRLIDRIFDQIPSPTKGELDYFAPLACGAADLIGRSNNLTQNSPELSSAEPSASDAFVRPEMNVAFESVSNSGGISLRHPTLPMVSETFVTQPQTVISARALAVLWRRYRRMVRSGPRTELDLEATTAERIRSGVLDRPVMRRQLANSARLLILADASPSMEAWRPFLDELIMSMTLSKLTSVRLLFFANVPRRSLFTTPALTDAIPAGITYERFAGAGLLVISDAGAARGFLNRSRVTQTRRFLAEANQRTRAIVWINPMPQSRWTGTSAQAVAAWPRAVFLPLDHSSLMRAVDILRGAKAR